MKSFLFVVGVLAAVSVQAQEVGDKRQHLFLEFKSVTAEARAKGDCVKSGKTGKTYQPQLDGRWAFFEGRGSHGETHWTISDQSQAEFYSKEVKSGSWEIVKCN